MHWTKRLDDLGQEYLRAALDTPSDEAIPPVRYGPFILRTVQFSSHFSKYIALHVRHGDFNTWCPGIDPDTECFAPLAIWAKSVDELRMELYQRKGILDAPVIVTSDEQRQEWWDEVAELGWHRIDHKKMETVYQYGKWYVWCHVEKHLAS
jgi:hypothetical protein